MQPPALGHVGPGQAQVVADGAVERHAVLFDAGFAVRQVGQRSPRQPPPRLQVIAGLDAEGADEAGSAWVLTFPFPLRFLLAAQPDALTEVLAVVQRGISTFVIRRSNPTVASGARIGAVTLIQRFGSALNL
jgi:hypothetical protein